LPIVPFSLKKQGISELHPAFEMKPARLNKHTHQIVLNNHKKALNISGLFIHI